MPTRQGTAWSQAWGTPEEAEVSPELGPIPTPEPRLGPGGFTWHHLEATLSQSLRWDHGKTLLPVAMGRLCRSDPALAALSAFAVIHDEGQVAAPQYN